MSEFLSQLVNGVAIGSVYGVVALGFVLVFGVAQVVNFAQGSQVVLSAYVAYALVEVGAPLPLAFLGALAASIVLACILELIAVEWLGDAAEIAPLLSTLALSYVIDQAITIIWSPDPLPFPNPLAGHGFTLGGVHVNTTDVVILAVCVVFVLLFVWFLRKTWLGRAIRAAAQDPAAAEQVGVRTRFTKLTAFGISGFVGAVGGVLVGMYFQQISPSLGLPFGLKGFAAAMLGGVTSFGGSVAGGVLIGILESLASGYIGAQYRDLVAFVLLLAVLMVRPQGLFGRRTLAGLGGGRGAGALPTTSSLANPAGEPVTIMRARKIPIRYVYAAVVLLLVLTLVIPSPYWVGVLGQAAIFSAAALGLTVLTGIAGQVSVGHASLMGVGAYAVAIITTRWGWPFEATLVAVLALSLLAGLVFALPVIDLSGHTSALATLALGQIGFLVFLSAMGITRGPNGIPGIPAPKVALLGGWEPSLVFHTTLFCVGLLLVAVVAFHLFARGQVDVNLRAIREDRLAAASNGVPVRVYLFSAFACSGLLTGLGGMAFAYQQSYVSPDSFKIQISFILLTMVLVGGMTSPLGAILGGTMLIVLPELLRGLPDLRMIIYGVVLLVIVKYLPAGLISLGKRPSGDRPGAVQPRSRSDKHPRSRSDKHPRSRSDKHAQSRSDKHAQSQLESTGGGRAEG